MGVYNLDLGTEDIVVVAEVEREELLANAAEIESEIRRNPAQYLWVHRRFKTRPPGEPSLYR